MDYSIFQNGRDGDPSLRLEMGMPGLRCHLSDDEGLDLSFKVAPQLVFLERDFGVTFPDCARVNAEVSSSLQRSTCWLEQ